MGVAESINLMLKIRTRLEAEQSKDVQSAWKKEAKDLKKQIIELKNAEKFKVQQETSQFKPRTIGQIFSLLVEFSYNKHTNR
jgi:hypothetical protein